MLCSPPTGERGGQEGLVRAPPGSTSILKRELHRIGGEIAGFLAQRRLVLHERKTSVTPCFSGIPFLGFVIYPGGRRRLSLDGVRRFRRRLRRAASDLESGRITPSDLTRSIQGWIAHAEHAQTFRLRKQIFSEVTFRCRRPSS